MPQEKNCPFWSMLQIINGVLRLEKGRYPECIKSEQKITENRLGLYYTRPTKTSLENRVRTSTTNRQIAEGCQLTWADLNLSVKGGFH